MIFEIHNRADGTDLGEYEADTAKEALALFLSDTDDDELDPNVVATPKPVHPE